MITIKKSVLVEAMEKDTMTPFVANAVKEISLAEFVDIGLRRMDEMFDPAPVIEARLNALSIGDESVPSRDVKVRNAHADTKEIKAKHPFQAGGMIKMDSLLLEKAADDRNVVRKSSKRIE